MRIGLCTGHAVVGNMGSKNRMDYTMMGNTVNTAARLEGVNKVYGNYILVSDTTYKAAGNGIVWREIDSITVVGKQEPVTIYQPLGYRDDIDEIMITTTDLYIKGLYSYRNREWDKAIRSFMKALDLTPDDGPSKTMLARCNEYRANPPAKDWNGAYSMTTK
jgi:adenylate cyclase